MKGRSSAILLVPVVALAALSIFVSVARAETYVPINVNIATDGTVTCTTNPLSSSIFGYRHYVGLFPATSTRIVNASSNMAHTALCSGATSMEGGWQNGSLTTNDGNHWVALTVAGAPMTPDWTGTIYYFTAVRTGGNWYAGNNLDWSALSVAPPIDWDAIQFVATSSSLFQNSTSSLVAIASRCDDSGNIFSRGLCYAGAYLFIPNPAVLNNFASLPDLVKTKFPFSWVVQVKDSITGLAATGAASTAYSINLASAGIGSTTPMGNILPNFIGFSSSTVMSYFPSSVWTAGQVLIAAVLWLLLGYDIYATVRRRHAHV